MIDLRSDTVTKPTPAMREAMAAAEVGDDVLGDDPTVKKLEQHTAEILGKEAALFVPSGTMANQLAVRCHTQPGDEMLLDANAHIYWYEAGGPAALSGVTCKLLPGERGIFTAADVRAAFRPTDDHFAPTRLLALENTHNRGGGAIWPLLQMQEVCGVARAAGISTHLDGARLWNAAAASGIPEAAYAENFDTVSVCFSKGLGAPVGSALAGSSELIARARRFRKMLGGGMRQVGIIAAGALYALQNNRERLTEDNANARKLALGLKEIPGIAVNCDLVETNMVYFNLDHISANQFAGQLKEKHVLVLATGERTIRAVTSLAVTSSDISEAIQMIAAAMR